MAGPTLAQQTGERITGLVERVTYHNPDNGYAVLKMKVKGHRDLVSVVGHAATVNPGEYCVGQGTWIVDKAYGQQFKAEQLTFTQPNTVEGMEKFLGSGIVKGIGPVFAKKLIKAFGVDVFDIIEQDPKQLLDVEGVGKKRYDMITSGWNDQKKIREIMVFLQVHGIGTARAVRIFKTYGEQAIELVKSNPYRLALDIQGIGFKTADQLAQQLGIAKDSMIRAQAGTRHVLQELCQFGHCAVAITQLVDKSVELLDINASLIETAICEEVNEQNLVQETHDAETLLFLASLHTAEVSVAKQLVRLMRGHSLWQGMETQKALVWVQEQTGMTLSDSQTTAVQQALSSKVMVITGGPGVGKTTVVNSIIKIIRAKRARVTLCAPTGRAAKRLSESTGLSAKTIHRLLDYDVGTRQFKHREDNPLETDCVVVDEASMIDISLMHNLLKAIPTSAAMFIVGDIDQLPSVGPGAVLNDVMVSGVINTVRLTEIFRQAASSKIITNAHKVNEGRMPDFDLASGRDELSDFYFIEAATPEEIQHKILTVVCERIPKRFHVDPVRDIQLLTPMHRGEVGVRGFNQLLQARLNGHSQVKVSRFGVTYAVGDKVMQTVNNYDKDVFNGDIGFITAIDQDAHEVLIDFDGREVDYHPDELDEVVLAYACTIHKSQGSEYPVVVIPVATSHFMMLQRNLLYTGITRGKRLVILVGQKKAVAIAVKNSKANERVTKLAWRLQQFMH